MGPTGWWRASTTRGPFTDALDAAALPWLQFHPEYGPSRFELSLAPGSTLEAADRLVLAKLVIQRVSLCFGWRCSFSPKPGAALMGNGGHLHLSLPDPVSGDPAHQQTPRLPSTLAEAAAAFAASPQLRQAMGEALHGSLIDSQLAELSRSAALSDQPVIAASGWWPLVGGAGGRLE